MSWREQNADLRNLAAALREPRSLPHRAETVPSLIAKK
jgi:hypothetical protein